MTPDELHSRRRDIITEAVQTGCIEECLRALESLDTVAQVKRNAYYDFLNRFGALFVMLKAAEGQPNQLKVVMNMMIAELAAYLRTLAKGETESVS